MNSVSFLERSNASKNLLEKCAIAVLVSMGIATSSNAATETWTTGTGTALWSLGSNWTGTNLPPISGDSLIFGQTTGTTTLNDDLTSASFTIASITFGAQGPSYIIGGNAFLLSGGITVTTGGAGVGNTNLQTISSDIALSATAHTMAMGSGGGNLVLNGNISGTGASIATGGTGSLTISGNNTYDGGTLVSNTRTLNLNSAAAIGTGLFTIGNGSTFNNTSGSAITLSTNNAMTLTAGTTTFVGSNNLNLGTGTATITGGNETLVVSAGTLTFGGAIAQDTGNRTLTKQGVGTLILKGAGTYAGDTLIQGGTLTAGNTAAFGATTNVVRLNAANTTLDLATNTSINAYPVVMNSNFTATIASDKATAGSAGITHTLGALTMSIP